MRFIRLALIASLFALPALHSLGCSSSPAMMDAAPFPTFEECWMDHHVTEGFSPSRAIEICCIDHPIGSAAANTVCGETATACTTYVTANLAAGDATTAEISTACSDYLVDRAG